ncbi:MAG: hypothetical protein IJL92_08765 [Thermoguttaceae bacterium]|nr:hypothetical protein [Thermoguttaceae bacterium]
MNPYDTLKQIGEFNAIAATLIKSDGATIAIRIKAESAESATVGGTAAPGAIPVRTWSTNSDALTSSQFPAAGDALEYQDEVSGEKVRFKTTRDATTGRFWNWRYQRRGTRIVFYTKYNQD